MPRGPLHAEGHLSFRSNWLRAAVLGANDGILSTSSLVLGVAAAGASRSALEAHARDELGLPEDRRARPLQAAGASALSFAAGAVLPLLAIGIFGASIRIVACTLVTLLALIGLGALGARLGGAPVPRAVLRVVFWGATAMAVTAGVGALVGTAV
ncbi:MAG: VIT1/CCC1 transporter family protein [Solirubrobacterales bacterium]